MKIFSAILKLLVLFSMLIWTAYGTLVAVKCKTDFDCLMCGPGARCVNRQYCQPCTR
uniref:Putative potassium channel toxin Tx576 n=1 Tax=Buthus israelis TaxID=2899555 RepID=B8XH34_BUTIS|nr:putative potassium channel toxin Tx576 [Buthus occitanus israelis]